MHWPLQRASPKARRKQLAGKGRRASQQAATPWADGMPRSRKDPGETEGLEVDRAELVAKGGGADDQGLRYFQKSTCAWEGA